MSLHKSILETFYNDVCRMESTYVNSILHGTSAEVLDPKFVGNAARISIFRALLNAISVWAKQNPTLTAAPESFLPEFNTEINAILNPDASAMSASEEETTSTSTVS